MPGHTGRHVHVCSFVGLALFSVELALPCLESGILDLLEGLFLPLILARLEQ